MLISFCTRNLRAPDARCYLTGPVLIDSLLFTKTS
jgi:hypothetical protein